MKTLQLLNAKDISSITTPKDYTPVNLYSSSSLVLTDFNEQLPLTIDSTSCATEVEHLMKKEHVRLKLVVGEGNEFLGTITLKELNEQEIVKKVAGGFSRDEFRVSEFMTPKSNIAVLDVDDLKETNLKELIVSLADYDEQHILVVEHESKELIGLVSCSDIIRKLKLPLRVDDNNSFKDVYRILSKSNLIKH